MKQSSIISFIIRKKQWVLRTVELLKHWCLNFSYNLCSTKSKLFLAMFSDSAIAELFSMGKSKYGYYITYQMTVHMFLLKIFYIFYFILHQYMNLIIMLRSKGKWICLSANVHYLFHSWESNQQVMCLNILILVMNLLQKLNFYIFFSDGPNVDLAFVKKKICGLHIVHNSFQHGKKEIVIGVLRNF